VAESSRLLRRLALACSRVTVRTLILSPAEIPAGLLVFLTDYSVRITSDGRPKPKIGRKRTRGSGDDHEVMRIGLKTSKRAQE